MSVEGRYVPTPERAETQLDIVAAQSPLPLSLAGTSVAVSGDSAVLTDLLNGQWQLIIYFTVQ